MLRAPIKLNPKDFPKRLQGLVDGCAVYDSSCSPEARVIYVERDGGYFLKRSAPESLKKEAEMTAHFHSLGLSCEVLDYFTEDFDWLLTKRIPGEDLTHYTDRPTWLCDRLAELLCELHGRKADGCPIRNRTKDYLSTAQRNYEKGIFDRSLFPDIPFKSADEAMRFIESNCDSLEENTLIHGDYCLPNVIMNGDTFSGFIDLGGGGVGDRHIDIFWGAWTLNFNLKTDRYRERFYDAYGRDKIDTDRLRLISTIELFG